jgi:hypothetical protein
MTDTRARVLEKNCAALRARGLGTPPADASGSRVRLESGPQGDGLSIETADGRWVSLHSRRDPLAEAERLVAPALEPGQSRLLVIIGLGLGHVLDVLDRRAPDTTLLALEPLPGVARELL